MLNNRFESVDMQTSTFGIFKYPDLASGLRGDVIAGLVARNFAPLVHEIRYIPPREFGYPELEAGVGSEKDLGAKLGCVHLR